MRAYWLWIKPIVTERTWLLFFISRLHAPPNCKLETFVVLLSCFLQKITQRLRDAQTEIITTFSTIPVRAQTSTIWNQWVCSMEATIQPIHNVTATTLALQPRSRKYEGMEVRQITWYWVISWIKSITVRIAPQREKDPIWTKVSEPHTVLELMLMPEELTEWAEHLCGLTGAVARNTSTLQLEDLQLTWNIIIVSWSMGLGARVVSFWGSLVF